MYSEKIIYPKNPLLQHHISSFWILRASGKLSPYLLPPDKHFTIILSFKNNTTVISPDKDQNRVSGSFVVGMRTSHVTLQPDGEIEYLGIDFYPYSLRSFLDFSCAALKGRFYEMSSPLKSLQEALKPVLNEEYTDDERIAIIEERLVSLLKKSSITADPYLIYSLNLIEKHGGLLPVNTLADQVGRSTRQLGRAFESFLGINPKMYSRIVRFNRFQKQLASPGSYTNLADLAYDCGFADQAHMIRECITFSGSTPTELIKQFY